MTTKEWVATLAAIAGHRIKAPDMEQQKSDRIGFAKLMRVEERSVRRWVNGKHEPPHAVEVLIALLMRRKITLEDLQ